MKALVLEEPHRLVIAERDVPEPGPGEVRIRVHRGGICGTDLHYYHHGGFGTVRMTAPMVLGHELSGVIDAVGEGVTSVAGGDRVAINPSRPCGTCEWCRAGIPRQCSDMRFFGSAMRTPHVDGGFREYLTCSAAQAVRISDAASLDEAAVGEPLSVCLHAISQAPDLSGRRVLISGFGPIGALAFLAARHAGAAEIAAADVAQGPLGLAERLGASAVYDVSRPDALAPEKIDRGRFDVVFECAGHPASIREALDVTRPGGTIVQVGMLPGEITVPFNALVTKELTYRGTFRFDREFDRAVELISSRQIDVRPIISAAFPMEEAVAAFAHAGDRSKAIKVLLEFA